MVSQLKTELINQEYWLHLENKFMNVNHSLGSCLGRKKNENYRRFVNWTELSFLSIQTSFLMFPRHNFPLKLPNFMTFSSREPQNKKLCFLLNLIIISFLLFWLRGSSEATFIAINKSVIPCLWKLFSSFL